jgi:phosphate transport system permease protein
MSGTLATTASGILSPEAVAARRDVVRQSSRQTLARRRLHGKVIQAACGVALLIALVPVVTLLAYTVSRGIGGLSVAFFTLFLMERRGKLAATVRFVADVMTGIPSIAIGAFAYALIVVPSHSASGISGSFALAVLMLPIIIRANEVAMRTVPADLIDAGVALGVRRSRVMRSVVLRGALPGIVTGNLLAVARAVGETAPLIFTVLGGTLLMATNPLHPMAAMPLTILNDGTQPQSSVQTIAWATAFVLLAFVLVLSIVGRAVANRLTRHAR